MTTKLAIYNDALLLLGERQLAAVDENREPRYRLDSVYDLGAVDFCLEIAKPVFARKTVVLNTPSAPPSTHSGFTAAHTLPSDYVTMIMPYSDDKMDQKVNRQLIEDGVIYTDYDVVHLRYVSNSVTDIARWSPTFVRTVSSYMAKELAVRLTTDEFANISQTFMDRVEAVTLLNKSNEPEIRSSASTTSLTGEWLHLYNDALQVMGLPEITSASDDSNRRRQLDRAIDAKLVESLLEDTGWTFGFTTIKIQFDPSATPAYGLRYALAKPIDLLRIDGVYSDEYLQSPLKHYQDEGQYFFADLTEIFLQYVSRDYLNSPSQWPVHFRRLVSARAAYDACAHLKGEGADCDRSEKEWDERWATATSNDAMAAPPRILSGGDWIGSRFRGNSQGRPGEAG